jgi:hypothetical protein
MSSVTSFTLGAYNHREKGEDILREIDQWSVDDWIKLGPDLGKRAVAAVDRLHAADDEINRLHLAGLI